MKNPLLFTTRLVIAVPLASAAGLLLANQFGLSPLLASVGAAVTGAVLYIAIGKYADQRLYKKYGLTRKEFNYIQENLREAKKKLRRLQNVFIRVRSISSLKQMLELNRLVRRIFSVVKKEPKRFYEAEAFFYSHLDSVVELAEKYALLNTQKLKNPEVKQSLLETKETLGDLSKTLEKDLHKVLAKDIEHLTFELDVAKHSLKDRKLLDHPDERRTK
ncbi:5-bromo-4-chloroindolyl phosphate hydrolysis family protein [Bacillus thermotolerans]|uniref:5-bromo-4-chloroindolyl phosphate hydrolysis protein n=1 Tax=Bacillus thermotolerans TaxID=1221996 RepID=A0A0F5I0G8_BACTR|nr:5-bromo-4-chloroindolyl phosphate hydrolysis family protein [Bacillus thermotolerans]KKB35428.1 5-bromo-4-chloroindolyl phosphate hydrolysis protein [Bacillus thermotolerans]KKB39018.1 5-bromo-4-chloroindolyl phosphate hydrolysis protein [Bacillus thermotolerans]KKB40871.1 5-bromo-4-chloroindolyl phosphate hydrolysis protein [Bacillus thermotolerans]